MGFISGVASPCCFVHKTNGLSVVVHGDDFTILGTDPQLDWFQNELAKNFEIKIRARLGEGCPGDNEVTILNRVVKITPTGLTYEANPRHAELLAQSLGLSSSNSVATPGVKDPTADYEAIKTNEIPQVTGFSDEAGEMREVIEKKTCSLLDVCDDTEHAINQPMTSLVAQKELRNNEDGKSRFLSQKIQ